MTSNPFDTIGFIGAGNMAEAMLAGLIKKGLYPPSTIRICDIREERPQILSSQYGVLPVENNASLFYHSDIVVLSVKPQQISSVLEEMVRHPDFGLPRRKLLISIAAGCPLEKIEGHLYEFLGEPANRSLPIIRVMPNTPALVGLGVSGLSPNRHATVEDMAAASAIFQAVGQVLVFDESQLDAVTALSGSGPAYVFYLAEAMIEAGKRMGLNAEEAVCLAVATLSGAAALLESQEVPPEELRRRVTSPGGTTEAAIKVFGERGIKEGIIEGILAAARRARELR